MFAIFCVVLSVAIIMLSIASFFIGVGYQHESRWRDEANDINCVRWDNLLLSKAVLGWRKEILTSTHGDPLREGPVGFLIKRNWEDPRVRASMSAPGTTLFGIGWISSASRTGLGGVMRTWKMSAIAMPFPALLLITGYPAARWVSTMWRSRRRPGTCLACGYDLRGSPERCPECGQVREAEERLHG